MRLGWGYLLLLFISDVSLTVPYGVRIAEKHVGDQ